MVSKSGQTEACRRVKVAWISITSIAPGWLAGARFEIPDTLAHPLSAEGLKRNGQ
jgi:hypothetical protein